MSQQVRKVHPGDLLPGDVVVNANGTRSRVLRVQRGPVWVHFENGGIEEIQARDMVEIEVRLRP